MKKIAIIGFFLYLTHQQLAIGLQDTINPQIFETQILPEIVEPVFQSAPIQQIDPASLYQNQINGTKYGDNSIHCRNECKFAQICIKKGNDVVECKEMCGDKILSIDEQCDDGNANQGDGCSSTCKTEQNFICSGELYESSKCSVSTNAQDSSLYDSLIYSDQFAGTFPKKDNIQQNTEIIKHLIETIQMIKANQ